MANAETTKVKATERDTSELTATLQKLATLVGARFVVDQEKLKKFNRSRPVVAGE